MRLTAGHNRPRRLKLPVLCDDSRQQPHMDVWNVRTMLHSSKAVSLWRCGLHVQQALTGPHAANHPETLHTMSNDSAPTPAHIVQGKPRGGGGSSNSGGGHAPSPAPPPPSGGDVTMSGANGS